MSIKITVSNHVAFKVRGTLTDANGSSQAFEFGLTARRLLTDQIQALLEDGQRKVPEFMAEVVTDWRGVCDDEGKSIDYSAEALGRLFQVPGVAALAFKEYMANVGAKEKN